MRGVEHRQRDRDEQRQRGQLDHHQDGVERRAFAGAGDQQAGDHDDDEDRRQIDHPAKLGPVDQCGGQPHPDRLQEPRGIARPADRDRAHHQTIFQDQRDPDHPCQQLAEHDVAVGVGRSRGRDHRRDFGIGQGGAGADQSGDRERQDHRRSGLARADPDQGQDAGADDRPDAQRDQMRPAQCLRQPVMLGHLLASEHGFAEVPVDHASPLEIVIASVARHSVGATGRSIILGDPHVGAGPADGRDRRQDREPAGDLIFDAGGAE